MVASGGHPDLKVIDEPIDPKDGKLKSNVPVELVRAADGGDLQDGGAWAANRVLLLDPTVDLGTSSANALLKLLEEPPAGVVLIVVAQPFLRSAGDHRLALRPAAPAPAAGGAGGRGAAAAGARASRRSRGAAGRAGRRQHRPGAVPARDRLADRSTGACSADLAGGGRSLEVADQLLKVAGKTGGILVAAELLGHVVRRAARHAAGRPPALPLVADEPRLLAALPGAASLDRCVALWEKLAARPFRPKP